LNDLLEKINSLAVDKFSAQYSEVRAQKLKKTLLTLKEGRVEAAKQGIENGVALRVLVNGAWGFSSVGSFNFSDLKIAVSDACRMARAISKRMKKPIKLAKTKTIIDKIGVETRKNPATIPLEHKIKNALLINQACLGYDKKIKSCTIDYLDLFGNNYFATSEGASIKQDKLYVWSRITSSAFNSGIFSFSREEIGSTAGYEVFDEYPPEVIGKTVAKRALTQLTAKPVKGGNFPVILGPNVVGVFVHEAFGHLAEADLALSGGILSNRIGKRIASNLVTLYDDGTVEDAFGSFKYDDEGVPSQKTLLVKDGIVKGLMHNRETAHKFNMDPTGNSRGESFRVEPIIRMRNTYLDPKDHSFEELIEDVRSGYYMKSFRGGQANIDGTFQVGVQEAYEITNGEIGDPVRNVSISGNTLKTLLKVDAVGNDFKLWPGRCGKGQTAFVCDGGPHIRIKEVIVGGSS
jgi:TldD protein